MIHFKKINRYNNWDGRFESWPSIFETSTKYQLAYNNKIYKVSFQFLS